MFGLNKASGHERAEPTHPGQLEKSLGVVATGHAVEDEGVFTPAEGSNGNVAVLHLVETPTDPDTVGGNVTNLFERPPIYEVVRIIDSEESIKEQLSTAVQGYQATLGSIKDKRAGRLRQKEPLVAATDEEIKAELDEWLTPAELEYAIANQAANPDTRFVLEYTPNIEADWHDVGAAAKAAARAIYRKQPKTPPYTLHIMNQLLVRYKASELSGTNPGNGKKGAFRLVPSKATPGMKGNRETLLNKLEVLREANPGVELGPLSMLDVATHWNTLLALGLDLRPSDAAKGDAIKDLTFNYHFDLEEKKGPDILPISSCAFIPDRKNPELYSSKHGPTIQDIMPYTSMSGSKGRVVQK